jgi:hypothetical protein
MSLDFDIYPSALVVRGGRWKPDWVLPGLHFWHPAVKDPGQVWPTFHLARLSAACDATPCFCGNRAREVLRSEDCSLVAFSLASGAGCPTWTMTLPGRLLARSSAPSRCGSCSGVPGAASGGRSRASTYPRAQSCIPAPPMAWHNRSAQPNLRWAHIACIRTKALPARSRAWIRARQPARRRAPLLRLGRSWPTPRSPSIRPEESDSQ